MLLALGLVMLKPRRFRSSWKSTVGVAQVHQAALVDDDRHAVELEDLVQLLVDRRIEVELVLEAAAAAADDAQPQIDLLRERAGSSAARR